VTSKEILVKLNSLSNPKNVEGMARYGIRGKLLGISIYELRKIAKEIKKEIDNSDKRHKLALELWSSRIHEAQLLAVFADDPEKVTEKQMETWAKDFDSWDLCDQACTDLFDQIPLGWTKAVEWSSRKEEFVKRGAFALMAGLAVHYKEADNKKLEDLFPIIKRESTDDRNFVKKSVNWALRNIGKRNKYLNKKAIETAKEIQSIDNKTAKWIASDAIRELESEAVQKRFK
jgi:3-methyladenine DNA glycosylase AlkD